MSVSFAPDIREKNFFRRRLGPHVTRTVKSEWADVSDIQNEIF